MKEVNSFRLSSGKTAEDWLNALDMSHEFGLEKQEMIDLTKKFLNDDDINVVLNYIDILETEALLVPWTDA